MKKITRILSLVLVFAMLALAFSSCTVTAEDRVAAAMLKMITAKKSDCTANINIKMNVGGIKTEMPSTVVIKSDKSNAQSPVVYMEMSMKLFGQTTKTSTYYKDGYLYTNADGSKTKVQMSYDEVMKNAADIDITAIFNAKDSKVDESFVITENEDGTISVKMTVTKEEFESKLADFSNALEGSIGSVGNIELSDTVFEFTVDSGNNISTVKASMAMKMVVSGQQTDVSYDMEFKYNPVGMNFYIPAPTDLDSYR